jgi:hypothetical protein
VLDEPSPAVAHVHLDSVGSIPSKHTAHRRTDVGATMPREFHDRECDRPNEKCGNDDCEGLPRRAPERLRYESRAFAGVGKSGGRSWEDDDTSNPEAILTSPHPRHHLTQSLVIRWIEGLTTGGHDDRVHELYEQ